MLASLSGSASIVRELIKIPEIDLNISDNEGNTALHLAAQAGSLFILKKKKKKRIMFV